MRLKPGKPALLMLLFLSGFLLLPWSARDDFSREFSRTAVMDRGRIKPLDSFARHALVFLQGRPDLRGEKAISWFERVVFNPGAAVSDPLFNVDDPLLAGQLETDFGPGPYSFLQVSAKSDQLFQRLRDENIQASSSADLQARLAFFKSLISTFSEGNEAAAGLSPLLFFPEANCASAQWLNPMQAAGGGAWPEELELLNRVVGLYPSDRPSAQNSLRAFNQSLAERMDGLISPRRLNLEVFLNNRPLMLLSQLFFLAALLAFFASRFSRSGIFPVLGRITIMSAVLLHGLVITLRMLVSGRPPVSSLYETIILVAWICALLGLLIEARLGRMIGIFTGSSGALLLSVAAGPYQRSTDSFAVLPAVLDANWWLTVHVVTIAIGYAGVLVNGVTAHFYLLRRIRGQADPSLPGMAAIIHRLAVFALLFTSLGTIMGGFWADYSWGRFWGWDPKENGALLIIVWLAFLLHARAANLLHSAGFAAGAVFAVITVALAWFGVNLLGVGLHSYGFSNLLSRVLLVLVTLELLFIGICIYLLNRKESGPDRQVEKPG